MTSWITLQVALQRNLFSPKEFRHLRPSFGTQVRKLTICQKVGCVSHLHPHTATALFPYVMEEGSVLICLRKSIVEIMEV